jgi:hypothetical protein
MAAVLSLPRLDVVPVDPGVAPPPPTEFVGIPSFRAGTCKCAHTILILCQLSREAVIKYCDGRSGRYHRASMAPKLRAFIDVTSDILIFATVDVLRAGGTNRSPILCHSAIGAAR